MMNSQIVAALQTWARARNVAEGGSGKVRLEFWRDEFGRGHCDVYDQAAVGLSGLTPTHSEVIQ